MQGGRGIVETAIHKECSAVAVIQYPLFGLIIGSCWLSWLFIGKYAGVSGGWYISTVTLANFLAVFVLTLGTTVAASVPSLRAIAIMFVAGAINGVGIVIYDRATASGMSEDRLSTMIFISMVVVAAIVGYFLNDTKFSLERILGLGCAAAAIYLLK